MLNRVLIERHIPHTVVLCYSFNILRIAIHVAVVITNPLQIKEELREYVVKQVNRVYIGGCEEFRDRLQELIDDPRGVSMNENLSNRRLGESAMSGNYADPLKGDKFIIAIRE